MFDLGKYADAILWSWGISLLLVIALILASWRKSHQVKLALKAAEERAARDE